MSEDNFKFITKSLTIKIEINFGIDFNHFCTSGSARCFNSEMFCEK